MQLRWSVTSGRLPVTSDIWFYMCINIRGWLKAVCSFILGYERFRGVGPGVRSSVLLSVVSSMRRWNFFNFVPKLHYLAHVAICIHFALSQGKPVYNPSIWATEMAEDYVGSMCKMSAHVNPSTIARRGIDKYLVRARRVWLKEAAEKQACAG